MLVATPQMRKRTGLVYFSWLVVAMVYYGGMIINLLDMFVFVFVFVFGSGKDDQNLIRALT